MRKLIICLLLIVFLNRSWSQNSIPAEQHIERVMPSTPEVSSITKNGETNVTLNTGAARLSIPLYEIKLNGFTFPISVDYSTSGTKVDEVPGRVGMGWTLNAGGVISRKVNDSPDDQTNMIEPPSSIQTVSQQMVDYFNSISDPDGIFDSEPDEFIISAYGLQGKFIILPNNNILQMPYSNNKIEIVGGNGTDFVEIKITTTTGIIYFFNVAEQTWEHNSVTLNNKQRIVSALFLQKILLPNGEYIEFNYTPITTRVYNSITQFYEKAATENNVTQYCEMELPTGECAAAKGFSERTNFVLYHTFFLSSINVSNSTSLSFSYQNRPDNSTDNRLTQLTITRGTSKLHYYFTYEDPITGGVGSGNVMSDYNKRFFLSSIQYNGENNGNLSETPAYTFEYNNLTELPPRLSFSQDHFGYYNGQNNAFLLPQRPAYEGFGIYASANREPDGSQSVKGTLSKIIYPTGGSQEFIYEPNVYTAEERVNTFVGSANTGGPGGLGNTAAIYTSNSFTVNRSHLAHLIVSAQQNFACTGPECDPPEPNTQNIVKLEVINETLNTVILTHILRSYVDQFPDVLVEPGNTYSLKLSVYGYANAGEASITYDTASNEFTYQMVTNQMGGVRVKQIKSYDYSTHKVTEKFYKYHELGTPNISSAINLWSPNYITNYNYRHYCRCDYDPIVCSQYIPNIITCQYINLNSSSATSIYMFDHSPFGYATVIESEDEYFSNGAVIHRFDVHDIDATNTIYGNEMGNLPLNTATSTSGVELSIEFLSGMGSIIKKIDYYYSQQNITNHTSTRAIKNFQLSGGQILPIDYLTQFDVSQYTYVSDWIKIDSITTSEFGNSSTPLITRNKKTYGPASNTEAIASQSYSSKGETIFTEFKYPTDFPNLLPYQKMIEHNIISPVIEVKKYVNGVETYTEKTNYADFNMGSNNPLLILPENTLEANLGGTLEEKLIFHSYDTKGNLTEVSKANDIHEVYLYGYNSSLPVAKIVGGTYSSASILINQSLLDNPPSDQALRDHLNTLRVNLPNAFVTTFTYNPFAGVTSQTNPDGKITYFSYDNFHRLSAIRNHNNQIVKIFCYTYDGLPQSCGN